MIPFSLWDIWSQYKNKSVIKWIILLETAKNTAGYVVNSNWVHCCGGGGAAVSTELLVLLCQYWGTHHISDDDGFPRPARSRGKSKRRRQLIFFMWRRRLASPPFSKFNFLCPNLGCPDGEGTGGGFNPWFGVEVRYSTRVIGLLFPAFALVRLRRLLALWYVNYRRRTIFHFFTALYIFGQWHSVLTWTRPSEESRQSCPSRPRDPLAVRPLTCMCLCMCVYMPVRVLTWCGLISSHFKSSQCTHAECLCRLRPWPLHAAWLKALLFNPPPSLRPLLVQSALLRSLPRSPVDFWLRCLPGSKAPPTETGSGFVYSISP